MRAVRCGSGSFSASWGGCVHLMAPRVPERLSERFGDPSPVPRAQQRLCLCLLSGRRQVPQAGSAVPVQPARGCPVGCCMTEGVGRDLSNFSFFFDFSPPDLLSYTFPEGSSSSGSKALLRKARRCYVGWAGGCCCCSPSCPARLRWRRGACEPASEALLVPAHTAPERQRGRAGLRGHAFACKPIHDSCRGRDCLQKALWALIAFCSFQPAEVGR